MLDSNPASRDARRRLSEGLWFGLSWGAFLVVATFFGMLVAHLVIGGAAEIDWAFLTEAPRDAGRGGGIAPILVSTLWILTITFVVAVPLGLSTAVFLSELAPRRSLWSRVIRRSLDVLAGVPSVVFGLFGNAVFSIALGLGHSILSGGLTLACMVLPFFIRQAEEALRAVPDDVRRTGSALGFTRGGLVLRIVLPAALPGVWVAFTLSVGRALAETAALLYTSGRGDQWPGSVLDSGRAVSVHIYELAMDVPGGEPRAYATALLLLVILFLASSISSAVTRRWVRHISRRRG